MSAAPLAERPVTALRGVGPALAESLARLGLRTVQDVLFHLPLRYEDRTRVVPIGSLRNGDRAVIEGEIQLAEVVFRRRRTLLVRIADGTGFVTLRFFHFSAAQQAQLVRGQRLRCFGEARRGPGGLEIVHPEYRRVLGEPGAAPDALTPIYPTTEGVQQGRLRALTDLALGVLAQGALADFVPPGVLDAFDLPSLESALRFVHRPPPDADVAALLEGRHPAQRRLAFEELLAHQLSLRLLRQAGRQGPGAAAAATVGPGGPLPRPPALHADRRAAARLGRDRARPGARATDDAAGAGRRRLGQDGGRGARGGARDRERRAGGRDGPDRTAGRAARAQLPCLARAARPARRAADGPAHRQGARRARNRPRQRRDPGGGGHACAVPGRLQVRAARARGRRRAAPLRRAPAPAAARERRARRGAIRTSW